MPEAALKKDTDGMTEVVVNALSDAGRLERAAGSLLGRIVRVTIEVLSPSGPAGPTLSRDGDYILNVRLANKSTAITIVNLRVAIVPEPNVTLFGDRDGLYRIPSMMLPPIDRFVPGSEASATVNFRMSEDAAGPRLVRCILRGCIEARGESAEVLEWPGKAGS